MGVVQLHRDLATRSFWLVFSSVVKYFHSTEFAQACDFENSSTVGKKAAEEEKLTSIAYDFLVATSAENAMTNLWYTHMFLL